jgi:FAD-dependent urate hydroxylase
VTKALIAGAGIAGAAAAMALQKAGVEAEIYEAHPTRADSVGTFLTLGSNGIAALRSIKADGVAQAVGFPTPGIEVRSGTGRHLGVARISTSVPGGPVSQTLKRSALYRALYEEVLRRGIRIVHGKRLVEASAGVDAVRATFDDGSEATGDLLIGCDGIRSAVRSLIDPAAPAPTYAGLINLGGYATRVRVDAEPGTYRMIFGARAFFGYVVAPDGQVWWFANLPRQDEPGRGELEATAASEWRRRLSDVFAEDAGPAVELIEASADIMKASPVHTIPYLPTWHSGRMIVLGDAAHAPSPSSGQGASLAIEDAVELARCLRDLPGHETAFAQFEALRRPRVERIIRQAARINSSKADRGLRRVVRDAVLPTVLKLAAKQQAKPYDHRIDWPAPVGARAVGGRAR